MGYHALLGLKPEVICVVETKNTKKRKVTATAETMTTTASAKAMEKVETKKA